MDARGSRGNDRRNSSYDTELGLSIGHCPSRKVVGFFLIDFFSTIDAYYQYFCGIGWHSRCGCPGASEILSCLSKLLEVRAELERQSRRDHLRAGELPCLWVLTPTASEALLMALPQAKQLLMNAVLRMRFPEWDDRLHSLLPQLLMFSPEQ